MPADERIVGMGVGALGIFVSMYIGYLAVRENPYAALVPTATVIDSQSVRTTESGAFAISTPAKRSNWRCSEMGCWAYRRLTRSR